MSEDTNELLWQQDDVAPSYPGDFAYELGWVALGEALGDADAQAQDLIDMLNGRW